MRFQGGFRAVGIFWKRDLWGCMSLGKGFVGLFIQGPDGFIQGFID